MQKSKQLMQKVQTFTDRFPYLGPILWIISLQYFAIQIIVAQEWQTPYSILLNPISDLGNTVCGPYFERYVCSPQHSLMNASFIALGLTMMIGSLLIYQEFKETTGSAIGFGFMGIAAFGTVLVGLFPENSNSTLHYIGALLPFLIGNIGLIVLSFVLEVPRWLKDLTLYLGVLALVGLVLFTAHIYLGLGSGGTERLAAYPQTIWLIIFGIYISRDHYMATKEA